jgi:transcriptional regulator with XRE-family HTH domain
MSDDLKQTIAIRVRQARGRAGISQEELASRIDRVVETVSNIERGKSLPTLATLELIANEFGVPVHELVGAGGSELGKRSAKRIELETRAIATLARMDDKQAALAVSILELMAERKG